MVHLYSTECWLCPGDEARPSTCCWFHRLTVGSHSHTVCFTTRCNRGFSILPKDILTYGLGGIEPPTSRLSEKLLTLDQQLPYSIRTCLFIPHLWPYTHNIADLSTDWEQICGVTRTPVKPTSDMLPETQSDISVLQFLCMTAGTASVVRKTVGESNHPVCCENILSWSGRKKSILTYKIK